MGSRIDCREEPDRSRLLVPVDVIVRQVNAFVRGWVGYFRYGNSAHMFDKIQTYARVRLAILIGHRHKRSRAWAGESSSTPRQISSV